MLCMFDAGEHWDWRCPKSALVPEKVSLNTAEYVTLTHIVYLYNFLPYFLQLPGVVYTWCVTWHIVKCVQCVQLVPHRLPDYACKFLEMCLMVTADHGPAVSGAHNTIVTARAGKDLVSCLTSGLLTIVSYTYLV